MTEKSDKNGLLIHQAQEILKKTYKEVNKIRDDLNELVSDCDSRISFTEEYSYGTNRLALKANHIFLYKQNIDDTEKQNGYYTQKLFEAVAIFDDTDSSLKRVNLKEEPEIWFITVNISYLNWNIRTTNVSEILQDDQNIQGNLEANGTVFTYKWTEEDEVKGGKELEHWDGRIIGFPLTAVKDKAFLKEQVIDKILTIDGE